MKSYVVMFEPFCSGFEHVPFNAALLQTVRLAFPSAGVVFYGEEDHLRLVEEELRKASAYDSHIDMRAFKVPDRGFRNWRRVSLEFSLLRTVLNGVSNVNVRVLICSTTTNTSLLALKALTRFGGIDCSTLAILHSAASEILGPQARRPWNWIIGLKRILALPHPVNLRLVVLGESILANVRAVRPKEETYWGAIDHPYFWPACAASSPEMRGYGSPLTFVYLGSNNKGLKGFCQVANDVMSSETGAQFQVSGFNVAFPGSIPGWGRITDIPSKPLPRREFEERILHAQYVVWTSDPQDYRLAASGTFLDAMAFLKPGIYLRNEYVEFYFRQLGDIGYLCDSYEEMALTIREVVRAFPSARYERQVENIVQGRKVFEPVAVSKNLRAIAESCSHR